MFRSLPVGPTMTSSVGGGVRIVIAIDADQFRHFVFLRQLFFLHLLLGQFFRWSQHMAFLQLIQFQVQAMVGLFQFAEFCVRLAESLHDHIVRQHCCTSWLSDYCSGWCPSSSWHTDEPAGLTTIGSNSMSTASSSGVA